MLQITTIFHYIPPFQNIKTYDGCQPTSARYMRECASQGNADTERMVRTMEAGLMYNVNQARQHRLLPGFFFRQRK